MDCSHSHRCRRAPGQILGVALALLLAAASIAVGFPLTQSLGNGGSREFHFCRIDVTPRAEACGETADCLQFDSARGPVWLDIHRIISLSESAPGTVLLRDMFPIASQLTLIGDPGLIDQVTARPDGLPIELHGYWYPSGRRLLLLEVGPEARAIDLPLR